ncbi:hypothetical protein P4O66_000566 [Electrophorus voltai]|uniref:Uncharacterized protein n=1 Tax=Electrophorus voltai TaxID=2609070 RepID=A0AAD9DYW7_9TELE|nr:hypothetical protein P4O66_000566 [Electrophorus voltai]
MKQIRYRLSLLHQQSTVGDAWKQVDRRNTAALGLWECADSFGIRDSEPSVFLFRTQMFQPLSHHPRGHSCPSLDSLQFAYHPNRSPPPFIWALPIRTKRTHVKMLLVDFSLAVNTFIPQCLIEKLGLLGLNTSLCNWILDFVTGHPSLDWEQPLQYHHIEHWGPPGL